MKWYRIAEKEGHHLAVKRLQKICKQILPSQNA